MIKTCKILPKPLKFLPKSCYNILLKFIIKKRRIHVSVTPHACQRHIFGWRLTAVYRAFDE
ncbi:hypothetical protein [Moraxella lacunata]|uniref:hypothetical protein n=1 Tax=Moraxella lacunata TaxID=477 RepID=UPI003EE0CFAB